MHQDVKYDSTAYLTGIGDRPVHEMQNVKCIVVLYLVVLNRCGH